jgi:hypothetical protein
MVATAGLKRSRRLSIWLERMDAHVGVCKETGPSYLTRIENLILVTPPHKYLLNLENRRNLRDLSVTGRSGVA